MTYRLKQNYSPNQHRCQIDCTNHDQVIHNLQTKSKDLYYFWRNYQWLYNKYYNSTQQENQNSQEIYRLQQHIRQLQDQLSKERSQNKKLNLDISTLKIQISNSSSKIDMSQDYQREIDRLKRKQKQYQSIQQSQLKQIAKYKKTIAQFSRQLEDQKQDYQRKLKISKNQNIDLQRRIDQLIVKMHSQVPVIQSNSQEIRVLNQAHKAQIKRLTTYIRRLQNQTEKIVRQEFDSAQQQLMNNLKYLISNQLSSRDLQTLIVDSQDYEICNHQVQRNSY